MAHRDPSGPNDLQEIEEEHRRQSQTRTISTQGALGPVGSGQTALEILNLRLQGLSPRQQVQFFTGRVARNIQTQKRGKQAKLAEKFFTRFFQRGIQSGLELTEQGVSPGLNLLREILGGEADKNALITGDRRLGTFGPKLGIAQRGARRIGREIGAKFGGGKLQVKEGIAELRKQLEGALFKIGSPVQAPQPAPGFEFDPNRRLSRDQLERAAESRKNIIAQSRRLQGGFLRSEAANVPLEQRSPLIQGGPEEIAATAVRRLRKNIIRRQG